MTRRLLNLLTALSLLLCVAVVALWVRSHEVQDDYDVGATSFTSRWGTLIVLHYYEYPPDIHVSAAGHTVTPVVDSNYTWAMIDESTSGYAFAGFGWGTVRDGPYQAWKLSLPHWFLAALLAVAPAARVCGVLVRRSRQRRQRCRACGYDLTGNETGVCPECGGRVGSSAA